MEEISLTSPQLAKLIGVNARLPTLWAERGYLHPSLQDAKGRGSRRAWSRENAVHALIVKMFTSKTQGMDAGFLRRIAHAVTRHPELLDPTTVWTIPYIPDSDDEVLILRYHVQATGCRYEAQVRAIKGLMGFAGETTVERASVAAPISLTVEIGQLYEYVDGKLQL